MIRFVRAPLALGVALFAMCGQTPVLAQTATSVTHVDVVESLSLIKTRDLSFGRISPSALPGTVTVSPAGVRTAIGGVTLSGGTVTSAEFVGMGRRNQHVTYSFGAPTITLTRAGGTETMLVTGFTNGASTATGLALAGPWRRISDPSGIFSIPVGATLAVGGNQAGGTYTGTFSLTVNYQ